MQAMRMAFDMLNTVTISTAEVDKIYTMRNELRRAYAILAQEVERTRVEQNANSEKEETDGRQDDQ
jgi:hypothetical protein